MNTWRRTVLEKARRVKKTWTEMKTDAKNRVRWRILVEALCSAACLYLWGTVNLVLATDFLMLLRRISLKRHDIYALFLNRFIKGKGKALLFHERGNRRGWVVSSTPRPHTTPGKDPVPIVQEAGWAGLDGRITSSPPGFDPRPSSP